MHFLNLGTITIREHHCDLCPKSKQTGVLDHMQSRIDAHVYSMELHGGGGGGAHKWREFLIFVCKELGPQEEI